MNITQERRIIDKFIENQVVSRNYFLDLQYNKILRLGSIICKLRKKGWNITTTETEQDTIYQVDMYCVGYQEALKNS